MNILIIGAAGMIGRKLSAALAAKGEIGGRAISLMILADVVPSPAPKTTIDIETVQADLSEPGSAEKLVASRPDVIFHLAAIVSGEAEADFEKGYRINLDGTRHLFEAIRIASCEGPNYRPRVVFSSSVAVFGQPLPDVIGEGQSLTPHTSYGTQKAIGELLLADYSRRGFMDGIGIRLPTIVIRPGLPNKAASGFFSGILREPLAGKEAALPVGDDVVHWFASPRSAVGFLVHAAQVDTAALGVRRTLDMPGLAGSVGQAIEALRRVAGQQAVDRIHRRPDPAVSRIIDTWPRSFDPQRAIGLGFRAETSFDEIIKVHIEDELRGNDPVAVGGAA